MRRYRYESVKGVTVKKTVIRYPLRVVRHAVDPETNPWAGAGRVRRRGTAAFEGVGAGGRGLE